jgi:sugar lactone lactonase YvrE
MSGALGVLGVAPDGAGNLFISDYLNGRLRKVGPDGNINTIAGRGTSGFGGDGGASVKALMSGPYAVAAGTAGVLYIADRWNHRVRKVDVNGVITTVAGKGTAGYTGDGGPATDAQLNLPTALALDPSGNLFISDIGNLVVRKVTPAGIITTIAGNGTRGFSGDGGPATAAMIAGAWGMAADSGGNLYLADSDNARLRKVDTSGLITTVAGTGQYGATGDGGLAIAAKVDTYGVAVDASNNIYLADDIHYVVRKIGPDGIINRIAGTGSSGTSGDDGPALQATIRPNSIAVDAEGNIYIGDSRNGLVRRIGTDGLISRFAGTGTTGFSGDGGPATDAQLFGATGLAADQMGNLYIAEGGGTGGISGFAVRRVQTGAASLSVAMGRSGSFTQGQRNAFTVTVVNAANAAPAAGTVTVSVTLGSGLTLVSATGSGWSCTGLNCTRSDTLQAGASYAPITVTVEIGLNAASPQVFGASVSGGGSAAAQGNDSVTVGAAMGGDTSLYGWIASKQGTQSARVWTLGVGNSGAGVATAVQILNIGFVQTALGRGAACSPTVVAPAFPIALGNLGTGGTGSASVTINFAGCDRAAAFTVNVGLSANSGTATATILRNDEFR